MSSRTKHVRNDIDADHAGNFIQAVKAQRIGCGGTPRSGLGFVIIDMEHSSYDPTRLEGYLLGMVDRAEVVRHGLQPRTVPLVRVLPGIGWRHSSLWRRRRLGGPAARQAVVEKHRVIATSPAGRVLKDYQRRLRVDIAAEVGADQKPIFLSHEIRGPVGTTALAVVGDAVFGGNDVMHRHGHQPLRQASHGLPQLGHESLPRRQPFDRRQFSGLELVGSTAATGRVSTSA
jgi:hypothetical protein